MNISWAITTQTKKPILVDSSIRQLKLIQMLVAKCYILDLIMLPTPTVTVGESEQGLQQKLEYIKLVLDTEDQAIASINSERTSNTLRDTLKLTGEFYSLVLPDDEAVQTTIQAELLEVDKYLTGIHQHRSFIFQQLYKIDYTQDIDTIKKTFRDSIKNPPSDDYYVYEELQLFLITKLDTQTIPPTHELHRDYQRQ